MGTYTTNYNLFMPSVGEQGWGTLVNGNFTTIDTTMKSLSNAIGTLETETDAVEEKVAALETKNTFSEKVTFSEGIILGGKIDVHLSSNGMLFKRLDITDTAQHWGSPNTWRTMQTFVINNDSNVFNILNNTYPVGFRCNTGSSLPIQFRVINSAGTVIKSSGVYETQGAAFNVSFDANFGEIYTIQGLTTYSGGTNVGSVSGIIELYI